LGTGSREQQAAKQKTNQELNPPGVHTITVTLKPDVRGLKSDV